MALELFDIAILILAFNHGVRVISGECEFSFMVADPCFLGNDLECVVGEVVDGRYLGHSFPEVECADHVA